jgi:hypothetical protein
MKKILLVALLVLPLAACATSQDKSILVGGTSISAPINNPVTKSDLYKLENGLIVVATGLVTYRRACEAGAADAGCRARIRTIQGYTRQLKPMLVQLRTFVRKNDQVNAMQVFQAATGLNEQYPR